MNCFVRPFSVLMLVLLVPTGSYPATTNKFASKSSLDIVQQFADSMIEHRREVYAAAHSPLPRASSKHDHHEAITRADTLAMALLDLWATCAQPHLTLNLVWTDR